MFTFHKLQTLKTDNLQILYKKPNQINGWGCMKKKRERKTTTNGVICIFLCGVIKLKQFVGFYCHTIHIYASKGFCCFDFYIEKLC